MSRHQMPKGDAMERKKSVHVMISGRVQGVFFRMETRRAAEAIGVSGWVRNLPDGRVEAVFEGTPEKVAQMLEWCRTGPPMAAVSDVAVEENPAATGASGFRILR